MNVLSQFFTLSALTFGSLWSCAAPAREQTKTMNENPSSTQNVDAPSTDSLQVATFGNGCFWCTEAVFQDLNGVVKVESGYSGGQTKNPTYREVCDGTTGHAEVIQVTYDPGKISFEDLLEVFWQTHDPTTLNQQGADVGTQYRSAVFFHNEEQKRLAGEYKTRLDASGAFPRRIVTEITPFSVFYKAEDYHQNYYKQNGGQPYCRVVIRPKMEKFTKVFKSKLKASN